MAAGYGGGHGEGGKLLHAKHVLADRLEVGALAACQTLAVLALAAFGPVQHCGNSHFHRHWPTSYYFIKQYQWE